MTLLIVVSILWPRSQKATSYPSETACELLLDWRNINILAGESADSYIQKLSNEYEFVIIEI